MQLNTRVESIHVMSSIRTKNAYCMFSSLPNLLYRQWIVLRSFYRLTSAVESKGRGIVYVFSTAIEQL